MASSPWDKIKGIIAAIAPTVGTALGGPFGGIAGGILAKAVTGDSNTPEDKVAQIVQQTNDPAVIEKLVEAENQFKEFMASNKLSEDQLVYEDIASARQMNVSTKDKTPARLAYLMIGFFCIYSLLVPWWLIHRGANIPSGIVDAVITLAGTVFGVILSELKNIYGFYFGSSAGSEEKNQTVQTALTTIAQSKK